MPLFEVGSTTSVNIAACTAFCPESIALLPSTRNKFHRILPGLSPHITCLGRRISKHFRNIRVGEKQDKCRNDKMLDLLNSCGTWFAVALHRATGVGANCTNAYSFSRESMRMVTGPSFTSSICMSAPNSPVSTGFPKSTISFLINASYNGMATGGGADRL